MFSSADTQTAKFLLQNSENRDALTEEQRGILLKAKTLQKLSTFVIDLLTAAAVHVQVLITGAGEDWIGKVKQTA